MENVHRAIAWYQTKIGSYDKQLWEQSVEQKLLKQPAFVLNNAPRKKVRLKTEYIDVDLIRGSTFAKTKPQVPWVYITRKAIARVVLFPFYYNWWAHQTSKKLYSLLLVLYVLQVVAVIVYLRDFDHSIMEDEMSFTEVVLPVILMFLLCLVHSQTVLAHINHKPPKRSKSLSGVTRPPRPKKTSRRGRSSGNNSTCPEDGCNTDSSRPHRQRSPHKDSSPGLDPHCNNTAATSTNPNPSPPPSIDMQENLLSRSVSDYDLKPALGLAVNEVSETVPSADDYHGVDVQLSHLKVHAERNINRQRENVHDRTSGGTRVTLSSEGLSSGARRESCDVDTVTSDGLNNLSYPVCNVMTGQGRAHKASQQSDCDIQVQGHKKGVGYCRTCSGNKLQKLHLNSPNKLSVGSSHVNQNEARGSDALVCLNFNSGSGTVKSMNGRCGEKVCVAGASGSHGLLPREDIAGYSVMNPCLPRVSTIENGDRDMDINTTKVLADVDESNQGENILDSSEDPLEGHLDDHQQNVCEMCFENPSGSDNLSVSDYEMVDHQNVSHQRAALNGEGYLFPYGLHQGKEKSLKSQDSSDSGINNEVPGGDCACGGLPRESGVVHIPDCAVVKRNSNHVTSNSCGGETDQTFSVTGSTCCHHRGHHVQSEQSAGNVQCEQSACIAESVNSTQLGTPSDRHNTDCLSELSQNAGLVESNSQHSCHKASNLPEVHHSQSSSSQQPPHDRTLLPLESSSQLQCFSETFVQEILNEDTLREMSCTSLLAHSDLENSFSSTGRLSTVSSTSSASSSSSCHKMYPPGHIPSPTNAVPAHDNPDKSQPCSCPHRAHRVLKKLSPESSLQHPVHSKVHSQDVDEGNDALDESLEHINGSDGERPSDDVSNYNPSDSDAESDGPVNDELCVHYEEKWKKLRFQENSVGNEGGGKIVNSKASSNLATGSHTPHRVGSSGSINNTASRSVVGILTRKPSPLKDLAIGRKSGPGIPGTNSSGSDQNLTESRGQLRRRRRTSGTTADQTEAQKSRNVPSSLGLRSADGKEIHLSSSENETAGGRTPEGSNKATMSSEEWEDRMQSDETTSSAYSSNSEIEEDEDEEEEEKTEYTTSTLHVINLLQPSGSPSSSGNLVQPDKVSCVIWEGNECKKVDLAALDIGWAIIDKVDSLPESSDYFMIGLLFSVIISLVPLVFRAYVSKEMASLDDFLSLSGLKSRLCELPALIWNSYTWREYFLMINGILQRFFLSLIFFFLLSVADRTFKQRLLYAKHFSYLTSSRRARKFTMPHFRLNKVRNIKIWLSLRSYLKRRGPQRSVDVIVSACFLCSICAVCLISLQMLKDTNSYLDYLCNWELLVWCTALAVFLMRFMTVGLKINKKYRNLSVLITEQINLYLQMEQKPHKKEELILANNVLRLAEDLLKELESPFKISGFSANPLIYNIMRVVVLSAFSAVLTEVLGFKLKLHKIKLKG